MCSVARKLHSPRQERPPPLVPLRRWFEALEGAPLRGGALARAADTARDLLSAPRDEVVLHGDLHHENVLPFGAREWLAIDPKGLLGERCFDFANILRNPDLEAAAAPGRLSRQAAVIAGAAELDRDRLLRWVLALTGLSAAWILQDGGEPRHDLAVAEITAAELGG